MLHMVTEFSLQYDYSLIVYNIDFKWSLFLNKIFILKVHCKIY